MKVLLTGASGFIGSNILQSLIQQGIDVVTLGRSQTDFDIEFIEADLLQVQDFTSIIHQAQATHLVHCAWYTEHGDYWTSMLNLRWLEVSLKLTECFCLNGGKHMTLAGTCAEYDWNYNFFNEKLTPKEPNTLYGVAKNALRQSVMQICAHYQIKCAWGRVYYSFGNGENSKRLIPSLVEVLKGNSQPFSINASVYRDFLHISDVAKAFVSLIMNNAHGEYNISSSNPTRLDEIVKILALHLKADPEPILVLSIQRSHEPNMIVGDNRKIKTLGWKPMYTLDNGLRLAIQGV